MEARHSAGLELAEGLVGAARARWIESASGSGTAQLTLNEARAAADKAMADLRDAEVLGEQLSTALGERAENERRQRAALDELRRHTLELRLAQTRRLSDGEAIARDRRRLTDERAATEARIADARRVLAQPLAEPDNSHAEELAEVERQLGEMARTLESRSASNAEAQQVRRDQQMLLTRLRQQHDEAERRLAALRSRAETARAAAVESDDLRKSALTALSDTTDAGLRAESAEVDARQAFEEANARHSAAAAAASEIGARLSALRARLTSVESALEASVDGTLARQVRARGGALLAEGLEVDPQYRVAVAAALGDAARGLAIDENAAAALRESRGLLLLPIPVGGPRQRAGVRLADADALVAAAVNAGGGRLVEGLRRDPGGHVTRLLARTLWVPALADALALRAQLAAGWRLATLGGEIISDEGLLRLAGADPYLQLRAERDELVPAERDLVAADATAQTDLAEALGTRDSARTAWQASRADVERTHAARRVAEEKELAVQRRAEAAAREADWSAQQRIELVREVESTAARLAEAERETASAGAPRSVGKEAAAENFDARLAAIRSRRDRLARAQSEAQARQRAAEETHRRAEVAVTLDESRLADLEREAERLVEREIELAAERDRMSAELAGAEEAERRAAAELEKLVGEGADERARLLAAERSAIDARERLRVAESRSRSAEVAAMEARLQLESLREQLLVELAGIGPDALEALREPNGPVGVMANPQPSPDAFAAALEAALDAAVERWQAAVEAAPGAELVAPSPGKLSALRRRFHELGAGNPFAAQEYTEVRERLESMETQREDLETAIRSTRELIDGLNTLITEQFRATFAALEGAFARRFTQLFNGGDAELSLTEPDDLSATGIEITARPPGKKRQPLQMLSGGERALTAVALLLAMLEVRPVPFCVLDEVDAALDEANIGRFSAALRSLADDIQFIVITHNRGTIEAADALYGVTIGDDAVSRIVSLKLPAVGDAAADRSGELAATVGS